MKIEEFFSENQKIFVTFDGFLVYVHFVTDPGSYWCSYCGSYVRGRSMIFSCISQVHCAHVALLS